MLALETSAHAWSLKRRSGSADEEEFGEFEEDRDLDEDFDDELDDELDEDEDADDVDDYDDLDDEFDEEDDDGFRPKRGGGGPKREWE